jgi:hypothetical protein
MKNLILSTAIFVYIGKFHGQLREYYSGVSYSNYFWNVPRSENNQMNYAPGFQVGVMASPKLKIFRFLSNNVISPYTAAEYSFSTIKLANSNEIKLHSLRASLPVRIKLINYNNKKNSIAALVEPGANLNFFQQNSSRSDLNLRINPFDFYINFGLGTTYNLKVKEVEKAGFKFSGISLYANKFVPIKVTRVFSVNSTGMLDQVRLNVGMRFTYQEPPKKSIFKKNSLRIKKIKRIRQLFLMS